MNQKTSTDAATAFRDLRNEAQYDYGHAGYTGTIAEKTSFVVITLPADVAKVVAREVKATGSSATACRYANDLIEKADRRIDDKWGPAGMIDCGAVYATTPAAEAKAAAEGKVARPRKSKQHLYLFFGWASS